jgi:hypothetical protein
MVTYVDIFEPEGILLVKYCSMCYPTASSLDHMGAAVQRAIDEGKMTRANTYIVVLTGKRPVEARQFVVDREHRPRSPRSAGRESRT